MKNLKKLLLCCFLALSGTGCVAHAETDTSAETTENPTMLVDNEVEVSAVSATVENQEEINTYYENQVSELIEQPDEDVFTIAEGETPENTEVSEVQDDAGSDAEMSGSGSESEPALPADEEAVEDLETPQETPETGSDEAQENTTEDAPETAYSTRKITVPEGQTLKEYCTENGLKLVAVIDTGISEDYAVQQVNFTDETDSDENGHGTLVAKRITANADEKAVILSLKAFTNNGRGTISNVMKALQYAHDQQADIINMSFSTDRDENNSDKTAFEEYCRQLAEEGFSLVAAAGNNGEDVSGYIPAGIEDIITVGSMNSQCVKLKSSNYGNVDYYETANSTSEAAGIFSGKLASGMDLSGEIDRFSIQIFDSEKAPEKSDDFTANGRLWDWLYSSTENNGTMWLHIEGGEGVNGAINAGGELPGGWWNRANRRFTAAHIVGWGNRPGLEVYNNTSNGTAIHVDHFDKTPKITFDANGGSGGGWTEFPCSNIDWRLDLRNGVYHIQWVSAVNGNHGPDNGNYNGFEDYGGLVYYPTWTGHTFTGWQSTSGRITRETTVKAQWSVNTYTNTIDHWAWGFQNKEGNNGDKNAFRLKTSTYSKAYGSSVTFGTGDGITPPNGFYLSTHGGTSIKGGWEGFTMPFTASQPANSTVSEYDYFPYSYKINYDLNGGTNDSSNPTFYNVLYGVDFKNPSREGYVFDGWYIDGVKVTGINPGANASFSSSDDMYAKLKTRATGDKTAVAHWIPLYANSTLDQTMTQYYNELAGDVQNKISSSNISQGIYDFYQPNNVTFTFKEGFEKPETKNANMSSLQTVGSRKVFAPGIDDVRNCLGSGWTSQSLNNLFFGQTSATDQNVWLRDSRIWNGNTKVMYVDGASGGLHSYVETTSLQARPTYNISLKTK